MANVTDNRRELFIQGESIDDVAKAVGRTRLAIELWLKANISGPSRPLGDFRHRPDERMSLYESGLSDYQIASALGVSRPAIFQWRKCRGLPANCGHVDTLAVRDAKREEAYAAGLNDVEIAASLGHAQTAVSAWRRRHHLSRNTKARICGAKRATKLKRGHWSAPPSVATHPLLERARRAIGWKLARDIAEDAVSDLMVAVYSGRIEIEDIERLARKFGNDATRRFASRYGPRSIDQPIPGTENLRLVDLLPDNSHSAWLDEMGATVW